MCAELRWEIGCFRLEDRPAKLRIHPHSRPDIIDVSDNQTVAFSAVLDDD